MIACKLGVEDYNRIAMDWHLSEALYSGLAAPREKKRIIKGILERRKACLSQPISRRTVSELMNRLDDMTQQSLQEINPSQYRMIGFSVTHLQLMSSLYMAQLSKRLNPEIMIVFGGRGIIGEIGRNLLSRCPEIDVVVDGEGEEALLQLARTPIPSDEKRLRHIPNLWIRTPQEGIEKTHRRVISSLEHTSSPDFTEYFELADRLSFPVSNVVLPIEASRGCSWEHRNGAQTSSACSFCSLNRHWPRYREKTLKQVYRQIDEQVEKYHVLDLSFVDACLPKSYREKLLTYLISSGRDLTLFFETRPDIDEQTAKLLSRLRVRKIQIGVESFSKARLRRLGKGFGAIDNINCLKLCEDYRIPYQYNLLTSVPGSTPNEVQETFENIPLLYGMRPPHLVPFFLSRGSRMYRSPEECSIRPRSLDERAWDYLPKCLAKARITEEVSYLVDQNGGKWEGDKKLRELVAEWNRARFRAASVFGMESPLSYRNGREFVSIFDFRGEEPRWLKLVGDLKDVFLACNRVTSVQDLSHQFPSMNPPELARMINELVNERVVMKEGCRLLSLPVRAFTASPHVRG